MLINWVGHSMKLNLGCGMIHKDGYVNIDIDPGVNPDMVCDLGNEPLLFDDGSVDSVYSNHFFEHLDFSEADYLIRELYRVCKPGAVIEFCCPHYLSPVAYQHLHKQRISEQYFTGYEKLFDIRSSLSYMRYHFLLVPCNVFFVLTVKK